MDKALAIAMFEVGIIQFGDFIYKSGLKASIYIDLRLSISFPAIYQAICAALISKMQGLRYRHICGVPYSALVFASGIAYSQSIPLLLIRKGQKTHGTGKLIEGVWQQDDCCLVLEDVVSTGSSVKHTVTALRAAGLTVHDVLCFLQTHNYHHELTQEEINLHSVIDLPQFLLMLRDNNLISSAQYTTALLPAQYDE
jgi:uridine monophosphate synthetase